MRRAAGAVAVLSLLLTGCDQLINSMLGNDSPHSLSASRGEGDSIQVSWSAPTFGESDTCSIDHFVVSRDGTDAASVTSSPWSDSAPADGTRHTYRVKALLSTGFWTGWSNSDTGWHIRAAVLPWGTERKIQTSTSGNGWFKTLVVAGWTYHLVPSTTGGDVEVLTWSGLDTEGTFPSLGGVWTAPRTEKVWLRANPGSWSGWYE